MDGYGLVDQQSKYEGSTEERGKGGKRLLNSNIFKKQNKIVFYATENQVSLCTLQMVKHFQEQDKIKTHKFTFDVHLAHYFFPILKQCKQVTYAFKTPLPLPYPPRSLSSYYPGVG